MKKFATKIVCFIKKKNTKKKKKIKKKICENKVHDKTKKRSWNPNKKWSSVANLNDAKLIQDTDTRSVSKNQIQETNTNTLAQENFSSYTKLRHDFTIYS